MSSVAIPESLIEVADRLTSLVPPGPAVYFLISGQEVVYIGSSVRPVERGTFHRWVNGAAFDSALYLPVEQKEMLATEAAMIVRVKPKYNSRGKNEGDGADHKWVGTSGTAKGCRQLNLSIPVDVLDKAKTAARSQGVAITDVVIEALCRLAGEPIPDRRRRGRPSKETA